MMVNENPVIFPQVSYHFLYTSPRVTETREYEVTTFSSFFAVITSVCDVFVVVALLAFCLTEALVADEGVVFVSLIEALADAFFSPSLFSKARVLSPTGSEAVKIVEILNERSKEAVLALPRKKAASRRRIKTDHFISFRGLILMVISFSKGYLSFFRSWISFFSCLSCFSHSFSFISHSFFVLSAEVAPFSDFGMKGAGSGNSPSLFRSGIDSPFLSMFCIELFLIIL